MIKLFMKKKAIWLIILCVGILSMMMGCQSSKQVDVNNYKTIPEDIKELCYIVGDENSDTVIVNTQGGPVTELSEEEFEFIISKENRKDVLMLNVHQSQTKNPEKFTDKEITFEEAIKYDQESIEYLYKVIKHFKDQNKKVYVVGGSFGAFMAQELIAEKGIDVADAYVIAVGRLDMNEETWKAFSKGNGGEFPDGVKFVFDGSEDDILSKNMSKLAAGLGHNRYTEKLKNFDLSKVTYIYGKTDQAVGKLTDIEIEFLKSRNATVIEDEGGHDAGYDRILEAIKSLF